MNRSSDPNATDPFAWSAEHLRRLVSLTSGAVTSIFSNVALSKITAGRWPEARPLAHNAKVQSDITLPPAATPFRDSATDSWVAATSIERAMAQPEPGAASVTTADANWSQQVGAAKLAWNRLSESELLKSEGNEQKLATLVREHYFISSAEASKRVRTFLGKQTP